MNKLSVSIIIAFLMLQVYQLGVWFDERTQAAPSYSEYTCIKPISTEFDFEIVGVYEDNLIYRTPAPYGFIILIPIELYTCE